MNVGSEPDVVGEVPAVVVGVFVDHDIVAIPKPVAAEADIVGSDAEIESAEPKAIRAASAEVPDAAATEAAGKVAVLPGWSRW
jgi:hypothetical protein